MFASVATAAAIVDVAVNPLVLPLCTPILTAAAPSLLLLDVQPRYVWHSVHTTASTAYVHTVEISVCCRWTCQLADLLDLATCITRPRQLPKRRSIRCPVWLCVVICPENDFQQLVARACTSIIGRWAYREAQRDYAGC